MLWRVVHDTLKWLWPAIFGGVVATSTVAVAAAQVWPEAKASVGRVYASAIAMLSLPSTWLVLAAVFITWLVALIWSGHKLANVKAEFEVVPDTPLHMAIRYLARDSLWAADFPPTDDGKWIIRADRELISALRLGRISAFGEHWPERATRQTHLNQIPKDFFDYAQWHSDRLVTENAPSHMWRNSEHGGGQYLYVRFSLAELQRAWPRRSLWQKMQRKSPFERWLKSSGGLGKKVIEDQDAIYAAIIADRN